MTPEEEIKKLKKKIKKLKRKLAKSDEAIERHLNRRANSWFGCVE